MLDNTVQPKVKRINAPTIFVIACDESLTYVRKIGQWSDIYVFHFHFSFLCCYIYIIAWGSDIHRG